MPLSSINNGTIQVSIDLGVGGAIAELKLIGGTNYINTHDFGRYIQSALYDGNDSYVDAASGPWGWNPTQGGDRFNHASSIIDSSVTSTRLYSKTQPVEWHPDDKGGGAGSAVNADVYVEQTVTLVDGQPKAVRVEQRLTYFGSTARRNHFWEIPAIWLNASYSNMARYAGTLPWSGTSLTIAAIDSGLKYASERWCALVDSGNDGIAIYTPGHFPYYQAGSFPGGGGSDSTCYLRSHAPQSVTQNEYRDFVFYLVVGDVTQSRETIKSIRLALSGRKGHPLQMFQ